MNLKKFKNLIIGATLLMPSIAIGAVTPIGTGPITTTGGVESLLNLIAGWAQTIFFTVAIIFIILAAFQYLTAQGDPEKIGNARTMVIYSIVAVVVASLASGVGLVVTNFLDNVNNSPTVSFTATPTGLTVAFASTVTDVENDTPFTYSWDFGDSSTLVTTPNPNYTYGVAGTYTVVLTVTDNAGSVGNATRDVVQHCDGKMDCWYRICHRRLGDPAYGCAKDFRVAYQCPDGSRRRAYVHGEASGNYARLSCY